MNLCNVNSLQVIFYLPNESQKKNDGTLKLSVLYEKKKKTEKSPAFCLRTTRKHSRTTTRERVNNEI